MLSRRSARPAQCVATDSEDLGNRIIPNTRLGRALRANDVGLGGHYDTAPTVDLGVSRVASTANTGQLFALYTCRRVESELALRSRSRAPATRGRPRTSQVDPSAPARSSDDSATCVVQLACSTVAGVRDRDRSLLTAVRIKAKWGQRAFSRCIWVPGVPGCCCFRAEAAELALPVRDDRLTEPWHGGGTKERCRSPSATRIGALFASKRQSTVHETTPTIGVGAPIPP